MTITKENYINSVGFQCLEHLQNNSVDLYLSTCGVQNCPPNHFFGPGEREEYIIHFICEGKGIYEVNGQTFTLEKGDFFVLFPHTNIYYKADENYPWDYLWVGFNGIKADSYLKHAGIDETHLTGHYTNTSFILTCIQQMMLARTLTHYNECRRQASLLQILAALMEAHHQTLCTSEQKDYPHRVYLSQATDYIQTHYREAIKINDIASYIGIDRSYLTNIFKNSLGLSPQEYLLQFRLNRACELLQGTDEKISYIALDVGYADAMAFSKIFRKYKGMSPSEFRTSNP